MGKEVDDFWLQCQNKIDGIVNGDLEEVFEGGGIQGGGRKSGEAERRIESRIADGFDDGVER